MVAAAVAVDLTTLVGAARGGTSLSRLRILVQRPTRLLSALVAPGLLLGQGRVIRHSLAHTLVWAAAVVGRTPAPERTVAPVAAVLLIPMQAGLLKEVKATLAVAVKLARAVAVAVAARLAVMHLCR